MSTAQFEAQPARARRDIKTNSRPDGLTLVRGPPGVLWERMWQAGAVEDRQRRWTDRGIIHVGL